MWRKIFFISTLFLTLDFVQAQHRPSMEFGFQGGAGVSMFYNQNPAANPRNPLKTMYGASVLGLGYQYNFPKIVSIRAEADFENKGDYIYDIHSSTIIEGQQAYTRSYAFDRINYVTIPVSVKLSFGRKVHFFTNTGMYMGFRMAAARIMSEANFGTVQNQIATETKKASDITGEINPFDFGLLTGLGLAIPLWKAVKLNLEVRDNFGFVNLNNNRGFYQNPFFNNSTYAVAGLMFNLGGSSAKSTDELKDVSK